MKLIKLTLLAKNSPLYMNVDAVGTICVHQGKTKVTMKDSSGLYYEVEESVDEVLSLCGSVTMLHNPKGGGQ